MIVLCGSVLYGFRIEDPSRLAMQDEDRMSSS